ncbi:hypothetical protein K9U40_01720 [Xanthobacter autotrophicus]|nr:hypothetical protein [Xanthobacter autotrophicus]
MALTCGATGELPSTPAMTVVVVAGSWLRIRPVNRRSPASVMVDTRCRLRIRKAGTPAGSVSRRVT